jgi:hypothetical protein
MNVKKIKDFVTSCTMVFKSYNYNVIESRNKSNLWHFSADKDDKKYVIYCAPDINKVTGIIKVALKKIPKDSRLVVICTGYNDEQYNESTELDYTLITLETIENYGTSMIEARSRS